MNTTEFITKLESVYANPYNEHLTEALQDGLKYFNPGIKDQALTALLQRYSTLPSAKNVLLVCRELAGSRAYTPLSSNSYTAEDFGISQERYVSWFATLTIAISGEEICITPRKPKHRDKPLRFIEQWIMDKFPDNLRRIFPKNIKKLIWNYSEHYENSVYLINESGQINKVSKVIDELAGSHGRINNF